MVLEIIIVSLTALKKPNLLYIVRHKLQGYSEGNDFYLYFQFEDLKAFQLFKFQWH